MAFAVRIVNLCRHLRRAKSEHVMSKQVLRSGTSIGANVSDMKFSERGVIIRFGDNVQAQNPQAAPLAGSRIPDNEEMLGGDASLTIVPEACKGMVENALRGKFGFTSINMSTRPGAIGIPGYGWECKIIDDHGNIVKQGEVGELCVKGNGVMECYYNNPEATAEAHSTAFRTAISLSTAVFLI